VENHKLLVTGCNDVLFEIVSPHPERQRLGDKRVLGQVSTRSAVRYDDRPNVHGD
jgi:hypothetical protein